MYVLCRPCWWAFEAKEIRVSIFLRAEITYLVHKRATNENKNKNRKAHFLRDAKKIGRRNRAQRPTAVLSFFEVSAVTPLNLLIQ